MENLITVKVFEVGKKPYWKIIENELAEFQTLVGGWIQAITLPHKDEEPAIVLIVNEEGKLLRMPYNVILADREGTTKFERRSDYLCGPVVACRAEGENFASLRKEDIPALCRWIGARGRLE